ncbi:MAG: alpha/beta hydrolase [Anaerolineales bacterium]
MSVVILQDEIVHYEVMGRGRPLLFLHSWVGSWRYWIPTMQVCSGAFRTYAVDLWGFGDSAKNPSNYPLRGQSELIGKFMEQMGLAKVALVGHGLGGVVALNFAAQHSGLVDRVMAVSIPYSESRINNRLRLAKPAELAEWLLGKDPTAEAARVEAPKADYRAIQISLTHLTDLDLQELSNNTTIPCLFVHGETDPAIAAPGFDELFGLPENTHHILFDQSGHFPMLDEPAKFNRLLSDFVMLDSGTSPRQLQIKEEWKRRVR